MYASTNSNVMRMRLKVLDDIVDTRPVMLSIDAANGDSVTVFFDNEESMRDLFGTALLEFEQRGMK